MSASYSSGGQVHPANASQRKTLSAKVVMVGNVGVGKTSICHRHNGQGFDSKMSSTLGASFIAPKTTHDGQDVQLMIWDTAGQERFRSMVPMYLRGALAAIVVFDVTDRSSFDNVQLWMSDIEKAQPSQPVMFLLGNKSDLLDQRRVAKSEAEALAAQFDCAYFEVSAASGLGIGTAMCGVADAILRLQNDDDGIHRVDVVEFVESDHNEDERQENRRLMRHCCCVL